MTLRLRFVVMCGMLAVIDIASATYAVKRISNSPGFTTGNIVTLLVFWGVPIGLSLWGGYLSVQPIRRRLYDIEETAMLIASGRLGHRVQTNGVRDEIDHLAMQFNEMGDKIEEQVLMLQRLAEENRALVQAGERAAALDERQRLARELHDSVSQQLFALTMLAASAVKQANANSVQLPKTLGQLSDLSNVAQREMRALLLQLRPVDLEGRSLYEAMSQFLRAVGERHQILCELEMPPEFTATPIIEEQLFRILQEAVANVLKHADANLVRVILTESSRIIKLAILDDGTGISEDLLNGRMESYGIRAMHERAKTLGGSCSIWRRQPGTGIEVQIPVPERANSRDV